MQQYYYMNRPIFLSAAGFLLVDRVSGPPHWRIDMDQPGIGDPRCGTNPLATAGDEASYRLGAMRAIPG
jgi:hypothetical protein